jgi:hypothetical protein
VDVAGIGETEHVLECVECGLASTADARGWRAYLTVDDQAVVFCSACAERELDSEEARSAASPANVWAEPHSFCPNSRETSGNERHISTRRGSSEAAEMASLSAKMGGAAVKPPLFTRGSGLC